jgi:hypothetical protein
MQSSERCKHVKELAPEETLPSRLKTTGRAGRAPLDATFPLIYGPFATGYQPVAIVSPPIEAPVLGAYFTGDRRPVRSDREGSGRALRLVYAVCRTS